MLNTDLHRYGCYSYARPIPTPHSRFRRNTARHTCDCVSACQYHTCVSMRTTRSILATRHPLLGKRHWTGEQEEQGEGQRRQVTLQIVD